MCSRSRSSRLAAEHPSLTGVKESSGDVRRITALRALLGDRLDLAVGLDDAILEGIRAGAVGWVAGLANAFPEASVELFERADRVPGNRRTSSTGGSCRC